VWTYVVRRLLLMVPTLFGITIINFAIINLAPAPRSSNVQPSGDFDASKSMEADEAVHIFRKTFYLDRPVFLNTRYALADGEVFWRLVSPLNDWISPAEKRKAQYELDDYGRAIVPHLLRIAREPGRVREGYAERWRDARESWITAGRPPGDVVWPPPEEPPPFDDAFRTRVAELALARLANNAPRRPEVVYGGDITDEVLAHNTEVRKEQARLRGIFLDDQSSTEEKLGLWQVWQEANAAEWDYSFGDKVRMLFLETRFAKFWENLLNFDLGISFIHRQKVWKLIGDRLHVSLTLALGSLLIAYLISIPLGVFSAVKHRSAADIVLSVQLFALYSLPTMFLGVLLVQYFGIEWRLLPIAGFHGVDYDNLTVLGKAKDVLLHIVLPMATLTVPSLAYLSRYMKSGMIEIIRADFIRTARAKGLSEFVVVAKHAVRNSLIPIITLLGASLPVVIGGSIVVEFIFQIDGMGKLAYVAVVQRDYAVIMGLNILTAVLTMVGVFLADLAYAVVDPRISYR
jgi:peptide/nickel transport system permease protein